MSESDHQPTVGEYLEVLWAKTSERHEELASRFHALSLAASFGALAYLISLETLLPPATSGSPLAIQISWCAAYLSAILGSLHIVIQLLGPFHAYNMTVESLRDLPALGEQAVQDRAARKTRRFSMWAIPHRGHLGFLLLTLVSAAYYRVANFQ